jgi:hypothetical protein
VDGDQIELRNDTQCRNMKHCIYDCAGLRTRSSPVLIRPMSISTDIVLRGFLTSL